jgi:hypothetical protein
MSLKAFLCDGFLLFLMGIGTLKNNGVLAETAEQKAEMLNNQITSVFTTENTTNMPSKGNPPSH